MFATAFRHWYLRLTQRRALRRQELELAPIIDDVLSGTDAKLKMVPGYRRKLAPAVVRARAHISALVEALPPAVEFSRTSFNQDPRISALFATPADLLQVFSASDDVRALFDDPMNTSANHIYALLCMSLSETAGFGYAMNGDVMRRDVPQTTVSFKDHHVLAPAVSESEARSALEKCMFDGLLAHALERLLALRAYHSELQDVRQELELKWRALHSRGKALETVLQPSFLREHALPQPSLPGAAAGQTKRRVSALDELDLVRTVLDNAHEYVRVTHTPLRLSPLNVKLALDDESHGVVLDVSEVRIGETLRRFVLLTRFPRADLLPRQHFLADVPADR